MKKKKKGKKEKKERKGKERGGEREKNRTSRIFSVSVTKLEEKLFHH